jgi:hypothetical protein
MSLPDRLRAVLELLEAGQLPPAAVQRVDELLADPVICRARRDACLRAVAACLCGSDWERAREVHRRAWRLAGGRYGAWKRAGVPTTATPLERLLFAALESGAMLPTSARQVLTIVKRAPEAASEQAA